MSKSLTFSVLLLAFANFLNLSHFEMRQHPQMTQESHQHCLAGGTGKLYDTSHTYHEDNQDIKTFRVNQHHINSHIIIKTKIVKSHHHSPWFINICSQSYNPLRYGILYLDSNHMHK